MQVLSLESFDFPLMVTRHIDVQEIRLYVAYGKDGTSMYRRLDCTSLTVKMSFCPLVTLITRALS
jgi:hypothetical protein